MSAQVTEAHRELARRIMFEFTQAGTATASDVRMAAQIIADSEAKATAELRTVFPQICAALGNGAFCTPDVSVEFIKAIPNEVAEVVAQLRAEVERLTAACDKFSNDEITQGDWKARAERAEAELAKAKAILASIEEDGTEEHNAAVRLRQELAAERARLRQIALDACRSAKITPIVWYPKRYAIDPNDFGIINEQQVEACAQAIDAAMKEGA